MVSLSLNAGESPMALKQISARESISLTYLEQLFVKLRRGGIVNSVRGPGGGSVHGPGLGQLVLPEHVHGIRLPLDRRRARGPVPVDHQLLPREVARRGESNRCAGGLCRQGGSGGLRDLDRAGGAVRTWLPGTSAR